MSPDPLIGQQLANFRITRLIKRGGMARVYYGFDVKLERPVAIKVIDFQYRDDPTYARRFVREARAMASWRHENIVQVYYADDQDGLYYFCMEYIDGGDLGERLTKVATAGDLVPYPEVLRIGRAIAGALDYAHEQGIIHRDVKPSNVMVAQDGRVVLTDFGLALDVRRGTVGEAFGSAHYIAPEQAKNSANAVPQSDLYSLGVILYQMLTGVVPFDDPSPTSVALQHLTMPPPSPCENNPALSQQVEAVLLKALSTAPGDRYQSGAALMDALEESLVACALAPAAPLASSKPTKPDASPVSAAASPPDAKRTQTTQAAPAPLARTTPDERPDLQPAQKGAPWLIYALLGSIALIVVAMLGVLYVTKGDIGQLSGALLRPTATETSSAISLPTATAQADTAPSPTATAQASTAPSPTATTPARPAPFDSEVDPPVFESPLMTPTVARTAVVSATSTVTPTQTPSPTASPTATPSATPTATATATPQEGPTSTSTPAAAAPPRLEIALSAAPETVRAHQELTLTVRIVTGNQPVPGIQITDTIPAHTQYVPGSATRGGRLEGDAVRWDVSSLKQGREYVYAYRVIALPGGEIVNELEAVRCDACEIDVQTAAITVNVQPGAIYMPIIFCNAQQGEQ